MDRTAAAFTFLLLGLVVLCPCALPKEDTICAQDKIEHLTTFSNTTECCLCDDANETNRCSELGCKTSFHVCEGYCVTHRFFVNNTWSISRRCGKQKECEINWNRTSSNPNCFNDQNPPNGTTCFFCCRSPSRLCPHFCSGFKYYNFSITTTVPTTTLTTMKSTTRMTMPTTIIAATPTITDLSTTTAKVKPCEVCVSDNGVDCTHKTITHCSILEPYCMNSITSTNVTKIRKSCATDSECYQDWWLATKPNPNCQGNVTGTGVCHYCCETLEGSAMPCNMEAIPTNLKSYTIPDFICQIGTGIAVHQFKEEICSPSAPFCLNTVSLDQQSRTEIVRKRCAEEIECLSDWWNSTRTRPECFHANGTGLTVQTNSHGESCHYCCLSQGTSTPCNIDNIPSLLINFTTATSIPEIQKGSTTKEGHEPSTVNSVTIAPPQLPKSSTTTSGHEASTINSVTIAPPQLPKGSTTTSGHEASTINSVTIAPPASITHSKNNVSTSTIKTTQGEPFNCYVCAYGGNYFVPVSQECADNQHFCINTIEDKRDGTRIMEKRCATEDDCFQKWWQESSDQEVCKKLYELGDAPSRQDLLCHFCCTEDYCNYFTTPDKSQLYDGNNYHG